MSLFMGMNRIMCEISVAAARHGKATPMIDKYLSYQCPEEHFTDLFAEKSEMKAQENPQNNDDSKASVIFHEEKVETEVPQQTSSTQVVVVDNYEVIDDDETPTEMEKLLKPTPKYRNPKGKKARKDAKAAKEAAKKKVS